jgi:thiaminase/transcriptional activator TenA
MKKPSTQAMNNISDIKKKFLQHPFIKEQMQGTLSIPRFQNFLRQDLLYLHYYGLSLQFLSKTVPTPYVKKFQVFADNVISEQQRIHVLFGQQFDLKISPKPTPALIGYAQHLLASTNFVTADIGVASTIPCCLMYRDLSTQPCSDDNPFKPLIDSYASQGEMAEQMSDIFDKLYAKATDEQRQKMMRAFRTSARWEVNFVDDIYHGVEFDRSKHNYYTGSNSRLFSKKPYAFNQETNHPDYHHSVHPDSSPASSHGRGTP